MSAGETFDVAVVGAGPAGAATATALCGAGVRRVVVLDQGQPAPRPAFGESVPPETRLLLDRLGVWSAFLADGHDECVGNTSCWGDDVPRHNDFICNPYGTGWHLDRPRFDDRLRRHAVEAGAVLLRPARVRGVTRAPNGRLLLQADGGGEIGARFVVDATGHGARVARMLGARRKGGDHLTCATALLSLPAHSPLGHMTILEAVEYGWWYAAQVPGKRASALVAVDPGELKRRRLHTTDGWLHHLARTRQVGDALHGATLTAPGVHVHAAGSALLDPCAGAGWAAVGDAAGTFDPLASQGIHKALADGLDVAPAIAAWLDGRPEDLALYRAGVEARFEEYRRTRAYFYGLERRWPDAPFWRARHEQPDTVEAAMPASADRS